MVKEEFAHNEQFLILPQSFHLYPINILLIKSFHIFDFIFSMSSVAELLYVGSNRFSIHYIFILNPFPLTEEKGKHAKKTYSTERKVGYN